MMLESVWFFVWGLLWAVFFITDGFDLGVGVLFPYLGKTEEEKRIIINAVGPVWNGNELWLLTAGGVSSIDPKYSLTAHNAASSPLTLKIMLTVVILFVPLVLAYQFWAYRLFKDKVRKEDLVAEEAY